MRRISKLLSIILAVLLLFGNTATSIVYADEVTTSGTVISSISITDMSEPQPGTVLDMSATVMTDIGAFWKIPVMWVDENGNTCTVYQAGMTCYPVFIFYLPEGYTLSQELGASLPITLPDFVQSIFGDEPLISIVDPSLRISYITIANGPGRNSSASEVSIFGQASRGYSANASTAQYDEVKPLPPGGVIGGGESGSGTGSPSGGGNESGGEGHEEGGNGDDEDFEGISTEAQRLVQMYCDSNAIECLGWARLATLVELVKYSIQPQAVNLLINEFPCFNYAVFSPDLDEGVEGIELGSGIGLYVYYNEALMPTGTLSDGDYGCANMSDAVAYVSTRTENDGQVFYTVGVNAGFIAECFVYYEDTNTWELNDDGKALVANTLVHEMLHAFMDDYTAKGMLGEYFLEDGTFTDDYYDYAHFPVWFMEGMATTVDNPYQYWNDYFRSDSYGYVVGDSGNYYDYQSLIDSYSGDYEIQLEFGENPDNADEDNSKSSYVSGYLACMYLGYMASLNPSYREIYGITGDAWTEETDGTYSIDNEVIKQGLNAILTEMHGGYYEGQWYSRTLDDVIDDLFGQDPDSLDYTTTDFQDNFITNMDGSAEFSAALLSYFEANSTEDAIVNGSVLLPAYSTDASPLDLEATEVECPAYVIQEKENAYDNIPLYVASDAVNTFGDGGKSSVPDAGEESGTAANDEGEGTSGVASQDRNDNDFAEAAKPAAAKPEAEVEIEGEEPVEEDDTEDEVVEEIIEE